MSVSPASNSPTMFDTNPVEWEQVVGYVHEPYQGDPEMVDQLFDAAESGQWSQVALLIVNVNMTWRGHELNRLSEAGSFFAPLYDSAEAAKAILNSLTEDGVITLEKDMVRFFEIAFALGAHDPSILGEGKDTGKDYSTFLKIKNGEEISEEEAKSLYAFAVQMTRHVIPPAFVPETLASQSESARQRYERGAQDAERYIGAYKV